MRNRHVQSLTAGALLGLLLSACGSSPTRIFTTYAVAPSAVRGNGPGPAVRVDAVHMPPDLDRLEVVTNVAPGELKINELEHWSAPLGQIARQTLSADLAARLPEGRLIYPRLGKPDGARGISVDVLDYTLDGQGASLRASWVISGSHAESSPAAPATAELRVRVRGTGAMAAAEGLSELLGQLADRIAAQLESQNR